MAGSHHPPRRTNGQEVPMPRRHHHHHHLKVLPLRGEGEEVMMGGGMRLMFVVSS